jgi:hypothetical protein
MKTFFEKRNEWQELAESQIMKNKDIQMVWFDDSNMTLYPNGDVVIAYDNENIPPAEFKKATISLEEYFAKEEN